MHTKHTVKLSGATSGVFSSQSAFVRDFLHTPACVFWELWRRERKILNTFYSWKRSDRVVEKEVVVSGSWQRALPVGFAGFLVKPVLQCWGILLLG